MKVALVISSMGLGGASRAMSLLANHWAARRDEVTLITLDLVSNDAFELDDRVKRVSLDLMGDSAGLATAISKTWKRVRALREAIRASGAEAVLSFEDRTNVIVILATAGSRLRTVVCERTDPTKHVIEPVWRLLRRLIYPCADALVVQTTALLPWAQSVMLRSRRARVVPNASRDMRQYLCSRERAGSPSVAAVGRLVPEKAFDFLVRAFGRVAGDFPEWRLVIGGDGPERAKLMRLIEDLGLSGRVWLPGSIAEPGEVLSAATVFVMSSRYEGFPNALLEAMACGLPVISTRYAGSVDLIQDGRDGLLVDVNDEEGLARAMRRLMEDSRLRDTLGANALSVSRRFALDTVMEKWDALLGFPCLQSSS